jgi:hypothetical protein
MSVLFEVSPNTFEGTGLRNISHACQYALSAGEAPTYLAYTPSESKNAPSSFLIFGEISNKGHYRNAFLAAAFYLSKAVAKLLHFFQFTSFFFFLLIFSVFSPVILLLASERDLVNLVDFWIFITMAYLSS